MTLTPDNVQETLERLLLEREIEQFLYMKRSSSMNAGTPNG